MPLDGFSQLLDNEGLADVVVGGGDGKEGGGEDEELHARKFWSTEKLLSYHIVKKCPTGFYTGKGLIPHNVF